MSTNVGNFKATILKEIGKVSTSPDLETRVLVVRDEEGRIRVSVQLWWKDEQGQFNPGKGFFLTGRRAISLSRIMMEALQHTDTLMDFLRTIEVSNTQRFDIIHKRAVNTLVINKLWRKSVDEPEWNFGKGLEVPTEKAEKLASLIKTAGLMILNLR